MPGVNGTSRGISAPGLHLPNAAEMNISQVLPPSAETVSDKVLSDSDKSVAADDVIESSSPLRQDVTDDDDANVLSAGFAVPLTTSATSASMIPPALSSLPSLMQLSRQALESRAKRSPSTSADEWSTRTPVTSHVAAEMFSDDDEQNDSIAEIIQVLYNPLFDL